MVISDNDNDNDASARKLSWKFRVNNAARSNT